MDREIVISCFWCGKIKTRKGDWVEFDEEINLALFAEAYEIVVEVCPDCLARRQDEKNF